MIVFSSLSTDKDLGSKLVEMQRTNGIYLCFYDDSSDNVHRCAAPLILYARSSNKGRTKRKSALSLGPLSILCFFHEATPLRIYPVRRPPSALLFSARHRQSPETLHSRPNTAWLYAMTLTAVTTMSAGGFLPASTLPLPAPEDQKRVIAEAMKLEMKEGQVRCVHFRRRCAAILIQNFRCFWS